MDESSGQFHQRPSKADFATSEGDLDGMWAWENFGGLSRTEAYAKFCDMPEIYQEHFMFMGGVAFAYYFDVIERYIMESTIKSGDDEVEAMWILAHCIKQQFLAKDIAPVDRLRSRCLKLALHVRSNLRQYCLDEGEQEVIDGAWLELEMVLRSKHVPF
jgi:hypothetical protein